MRNTNAIQWRLRRAACLLVLGMCLWAPLAGRAATPWTQNELRRFARDLSDYVIAHHIQRDPKSLQDGMVFKWYRPGDGRWVMDTDRNMMGDGAWFADALCLYHRATREEWALNVLKKYPLPFYEKVLTGSDKLFGVSQGICPLWWSDGTAVARDGNAVMGFAKPPHMTSNALATDIAAMLMSAGPLCPESKVTDVVTCLLRGDRACYGDPTVPLPLGITAAMLGNDDTLQARCLPLIPWQNYDGSDDILSAAIFSSRTNSPAAALEQAMINYRMHVLTQPLQPISPGFAKQFINTVYTALRLADLWNDDAPRQAGLTPFDDPSLTVADKLAFYHSDKRNVAGLGSRHGPMLLCGAAIALQLMDAFPGVWEGWYRQRHAVDARISEISAELPVLAESGPVEMAWTPSSLRVHTRRPMKLLLASATSGDNTSTTVSIDAAGHATAVNNKGAKLRLVAAPLPNNRTELEIPFTLVKSQAQWLNAVEDSRWIARFDEGTPFSLLFLSQPGTVRARLALELVDGLRYWQKVFNDKGYVPTVTPSGPSPANADDELSDAGSHAFLIAAIAEYHIWLNGERDWELALKTQTRP